MPERAEDLAPAVRNVLVESGGKRFNIVIDALDEALDAAQARLIVQGIVLPLVETCADVGVQAVVGSRRRDDWGDLLRAFGDGLNLIDLDSPKYFELEDLEAYALATLQLRGTERANNPYADDAVARPVAARIAVLSDRNFLVAGLTALNHGLRDREAIAAEDLAFSPKVEDALNAYLSRIEPVDGVVAALVLTVLAFARSPGLPIDLWAEGLNALTGQQISEYRLLEFARSSAANFLIEQSAGTSSMAFRLFHQALNDTLLKDRSDRIPVVTDERSLTRAFLTYGKQLGWARAPSYLLQSLARHAIAGQIFDEILGEDDYLLYADLERLIPLVDEASSALGQERARLLRLTPYAIGATPESRIALFSVTEALENLSPKYQTSDKSAPYRARWAATTARAERSVLEGHNAAVSSVCAFILNNQVRIAAAGEDSTILVWDPDTAMQLWRLYGHKASARSVCALQTKDRTLLASAGDDGTIRIWRLEPVGEERVIKEANGPVLAICAFCDADGRARLASGGSHGTVSLWDPTNGQKLSRLVGHTGNVPAVCSYVSDDGIWLATGGEDATIRIWNPVDGSLERILYGHTGVVWALCTFRDSNGRTVLASTGSDGTVRLWDAVTGTVNLVLDGHIGWIWGICAFTSAGKSLLALACADGKLRIWSTESGEEQRVLEGHEGEVWDVSSFSYVSGGRALLASAGSDKTVRIWDSPAAQQTDITHTGTIRSISVFNTEERQVVAAGGDDGVLRGWDATTGQQRWMHALDSRPIYATCAISNEAGALLAIAGSDEIIHIWDPVTEEMQSGASFYARNPVRSLSCLKTEDATFLVMADEDGAVHLYDMNNHSYQTLYIRERDGAYRANPQILDRSVTAVSAFRHKEDAVLVTGGDDGSLTIDVATKNARNLFYPYRPMERNRRRRLKPRHLRRAHEGEVFALSPFHIGSNTFLATAGVDRAVRIWGLTRDRPYGSLEGHTGAVRALCPFTTDDGDLLVSTGDDRTARIWDPISGNLVQVIRLHHPALALAQAGDLLAVGLSAGLLLIQPDLAHRADRRREDALPLQYAQGSATGRRRRVTNQQRRRGSD